MEEVVTATGGDSGTTVSTEDDSYGYRWMILRSPEGAPSVEDLAVGINAVSGSIETAGHGERLLCAVFAFVDAKKTAASTSSTTTSAASGTRSSRPDPAQPAPARTPRRAALDRARAAAQGADRLRTADRARTRALVPAVGHPDLGVLAWPAVGSARALPTPAGAGASVGDQALAGELSAGLGEA